MSLLLLIFFITPIGIGLICLISLMLLIIKMIHSIFKSMGIGFVFWGLLFLMLLISL